MTTRLAFTRVRGLIARAHLPNDFERTMLKIRMRERLRRAREAFEHRGERYATVRLIRAIEHSRRVLGEEHAQGFITLDEVASGLAERGSLRRARVVNSWAAAGLHRALGPGDRATLTATTRRARLLWQTGEGPVARELAERVLTVCRQRLGDDDPQTLDATATLGVILADLGELQRALELQQRACDGRVARFGDNHPDSVESMTDVFTTLAKLRQIESATGLLPRIQRARSAIFVRRNEAAATLDFGAIMGGNLAFLDTMRALEAMLATGKVSPRRGR